MIDVEAFIDGYIECALWADCYPVEAFSEPDSNWESGGREDLELRDGARERMAVDCLAFCEANARDLEEYCERRGYDSSQGPVSSYAGQDFWLTRSGHGAGFWDRGLGDLGERLSDAARAYGSPDDHTPYDCGDGTADV